MLQLQVYAKQSDSNQNDWNYKQIFKCVERNCNISSYDASLVLIINKYLWYINNY